MFAKAHMTSLDNLGCMLLDSEGRASSSLRTHLAKAADRPALKAVRAFVTNDLGDFYLHAGMSLEPAIKSKPSGF
jgi:hypothetical protein